MAALKGYKMVCTMADKAPKEKVALLEAFGVDAVGSVYKHYKMHGELPPAEAIHQYLIDGIGEDLLPESVWMDTIDEVV